MKKTLSLVLILSLAFCLALPAAAEETMPIINWADLESAASEIEASFVTFDEVAVKIWMPSIFQPMTLSEEDKEVGSIAQFMTIDESALVLVQFLSAGEGVSFDSLMETLRQNNAEDIEHCVINGLEAIDYTDSDTDAVFVVFLTEDDNILQFIFYPASDEGFFALAQLMAASIQADE